MKSVLIHSIAVLLTGTVVPVVSAADVTTIPISTDAALPVAQSSGFDWSGFYAGVFGSVQDGPVAGTQYGLGIHAGVNTQFDFYLVGAEVAVQGLGTDGIDDTTYGQILGRAGLVVSDNVAVYAAGGYGIDLGPPSEEDILAGGGVELSLTDSVSVRAQYLHSFPTVGGNPKNQFTLGASYHF